MLCSAANGKRQTANSDRFAAPFNRERALATVGAHWRCLGHRRGSTEKPVWALYRLPFVASIHLKAVRVHADQQWAICKLAGHTGRAQHLS